MKEWREFMAKYLPGGDINDITYVYAYSCCKTLMQVLKQCGDDFSRENIMRQVTKPEGSGTADTAARHQDQHQPDQLSADACTPTHAMGRQDLGTLWQCDRGCAGISQIAPRCSFPYRCRLIY